MIQRAPIAITMGDPAGIGPEITMHAWRAHLNGKAPRFCVVGAPEVYHALTSSLAIIAAPADAAATGEALPVIPVSLAAPVRIGIPDAANARAILESIERATALALAGDVSAIVTSPISKATLYEAGFTHQGHTDFLGALTSAYPFAGERGPVMMLAAQDLRVALVTEHLPIERIPAALSADRIVKVARVVAESLRNDFGITQPRLAIAALNPHAGEQGKIGLEEQKIIEPAVTILNGAGINAHGPHPADTLFHAEARRDADAIICMYHDQGLIPLKMLDFWSGVNITLGLPIVRTSPDHGTGFSIAGKGAARADSLFAALKMAESIAVRRAQ